MPYDRAVFLGDQHAPSHDEGVIATSLAFIREAKPSLVVLLGDLWDAYSLSRFAKDPALATRVQSEVDSAADILRRVREAAVRSRLVLLRGNHEQRLQTYLRTQAPALSGLRSLTVEGLLDLKAVRCEYASTGQLMLCDGKLLIKHGTIVRAKAGYSATAELEKAWVSGASGHTHRLATVYRRNKSGSFVWCEAGCGCDLEAEYLEGETADWQHGLLYAELERGGNRFTMQTVAIVNGRIVFGGKEVNGKRR